VKVSARIRYGCRAMVALAGHVGEDRPIPLEVLAAEQEIPERYLAKIIQDLRKAGLIRSVRGARGGYRLARRSSDITALQVWEALEGPLMIVPCIEDKRLCEVPGGCGLHTLWSRLQEANRDVLASTSLDELRSAFEALGEASEHE
jgi:Rrf2 family protein